MSRITQHCRRHLWGALALTAGALALLWAHTPAQADTVTLKTGRVIEGIIDQESSSESRVVIRTPAGVINVPRANVASLKKDKDLSYAEASGDLAALGGDLDRARGLYESALNTDPGNTALADKIKALLEKIDRRDDRKYGQALRQIAQTLADADFDEAIGLARTLMERAPEDSMHRRCRQAIVDAWLGIARRHRELTKWDAAQTAYLSAFEEAPEDPLPPLELAEMLSETPKGQLAAIAFFKQAFDLAKSHPSQIEADRLLHAQFILGRNYYDLGNYRLATVTLLNVMRRDVHFNHPEAIDLAVDAYGKIGANSSPADQQEIVNNLEGFILIYEKNERAILLLGRVYFDMSDWRHARDTLKMITKTPDPNDTSPAIQEALYYQGVAERRLGQFPDADQSLDRIITGGGERYEVFLELAELRLRATRFQDAYDLFSKALALNKTQARPFYGKGKVLTEIGLYDEALVNLNRAAELAPRNPDIRYEIARNHLAMGNYEEAIKLGRGIIRFIKKNAAAPLTAGQTRMIADCFMILGEANTRLDKPTAARQRYAKATEYEPDAGRGHEAIALSYQTEGLHKEAQEAFEKALGLDPDNPKFNLNMARHWHQVVKNPRKALPYYLKYLDLGGTDTRVDAWIKECGGTPPSRD